VTIEQESTTITCLEAQLNETDGLVLLKDSILIKNPDGEIKAENAIYYFESRTGFLRRNVALSRRDQVITADSLDYDGIKKFLRMWGNIKIEDLRNEQIAYGEEGWYDIGEEKGSLKKNPHLEISRKDKSPMLIRAREFFLLNKENKFYGYDSIEGTIDSITIYCDTMEYNLKEDHGFLKRPIVREKKNELQGDFGEFLLREKNLEYFKVFNGTGNYWTKEGSQNIVSGDTITILFKENRAFRVWIEGSPKGVLILKEKENAKD